ncbi:hypothetical protein QR680_013235 [Steinernema hermaphroditum]|uniref:Uncharacterized protein n=1 Tax=Steinernema hermaphroditum TaxID=289476 RepID=A0AA39I7L7_9BILA|nr:hypothetical protein QR680_013235 [Steinernema hermaphroditum]
MVTSFVARTLLVFVLVTALVTVVESRSKANLHMLRDLLEERRANIEQELEALDDALSTRSFLEKLHRNRRRIADLSIAEMKSVKRTRCYFNPISC